MIMANIAQMINVLQSVILTDKDKMVKTPTYHVFNMYKHHQDAELLESFIETKEIGVDDEFKVPNLTESVSLGKDGKVHATVTNLSATESYEIGLSLTDTEIKSIKGEIVGGEMHLHNTFENPDAVTVKAFEDIKLEGKSEARLTIPASSVLHLEIEI